MNRILVSSQFKRYEILKARVQKAARATLRILKKEKTHVEVEFFLLSDSEIKKINKKFRNKNKATNILSFEEPKKFVRPQKGRFLGEIYIAPDFIQKHKQNLEHMVVHGLLHLCGYDHVDGKDAKKMEKKESSILRALYTLSSIAK